MENVYLEYNLYDMRKYVHNAGICSDTYRNVYSVHIDIIVVANCLRSGIQYFRINEYQMLPSIAIYIHSVIMFYSFLMHLN